MQTKIYQGIKCIQVLDFVSAEVKMSEARAPLQEVKPSRYSIVAQLQLQHKFTNELKDATWLSMALLRPL